MTVALAKPLDEVVVTLIAGRHRHTRRIGNIVPGRVLLLSLDEFSPEPAVDFAPTVIDVSGRAPDGTTVHQAIAIAAVAR